jgi:protein TonB
MAARARRKSAVTAAVVVAGLVVVVALVVLLVKSMLEQGGKPRKTTIQQIAVLKPPPPPPPPKPEVKPPEMKKEEVKIEQPKEQPPDQAKTDQGPPPGDKLALDAEGSSSSDGFGLAARKGGQDLLTVGKGTGGERAQFGWYTGRLQRHLQEELAKREDLKKSDYRVVVRIWLARDGRVERAEVAGSSGNADTDQAIREALGRVSSLAEAPPDNMPQPIRLRITSRGAG